MTDIAINPGRSPRTERAMRDVLEGRRGGIRGFLPFFGPAVIASIAYMDPGNYATNIQAGAKYGYMLLWVVLVANLIAMLFQALSAKLGIVTGRNLAEMCRERYPRPVVWVMWVVSELAAMATDLAEFLGGAIGLSLLAGIPLVWGMVITAIVTYGILLFEGRGFRFMEPVIGAMVAVIGLCYLVELFLGPRRLGHGGAWHRHAAIARPGRAADLGRHRRRHRDAACAVPPFRPDPVPRPSLATTASAKCWSASPTGRSC